MENGNINLVNRLNDFRDRIPMFRNFKAFFNELDEPTQKKIIYILENLPEDYIKRFANSLLGCYRMMSTGPGSGVYSEDIDIIIAGELILKELRDKGYISPEQSNELSKKINELLDNDSIDDDFLYLKNDNAKEFIDFLKENRNNDSLTKDNSFLFEVGEKLLEKNSLGIIEDRYAAEIKEIEEISKKEDLQKERDEKFDDILENLKENQPEQYNKILEILNAAGENGKYGEVSNALIEIYKKDETNGTKIFDKVLDVITDEIIYSIANKITDFEKFFTMFSMLNKETQDKIINILENVPNQELNKLVNLNELSDESVKLLINDIGKALENNVSKQETSLIKTGKSEKREEKNDHKSDKNSASKSKKPLKKMREPKKPPIIQMINDESNKLEMQHKKKNAQIIQKHKKVAKSMR